MRYEGCQARPGLDVAVVLEINSVCRILDANFNRSREALRVMEEFARFVLDDASLTQAIKTARHDVTTAFKSLSLMELDGGHSPSYELVGYRDITGDVGTSISTPAESQRTTTIDVLSAACKRLTESLRSLEEYGKVIDTTFAAAIEQLRYRAYELERRLMAHVHARQKFGKAALYVLVTESFCRKNWFETARAALEGGADCIQLREKNLPDSEFLARATRLAQLCRDYDRLFIVNDRPDIAIAAGAHGVHLGQEDLSIAAVRRILPPRMIVGLSTHVLSQVEAGILLAPDYIALGPMFDSPTKPQPHVAGPALLVEARKRTALPLVAIGGIHEENVAAVLAAADACICVCQAVVAASDPCEAARQIRNRFTPRQQKPS